MVDRLHPGAGVNSFLRDNSILNNAVSGRGTVPIDKVASSGNSNNTITPTVPVTEYDRISVVEKPSGTVALDDLTQTTTANVNVSQTTSAEKYTLKDNPVMDVGKEAANSVSGVIKKFVTKDTFKASRQPRNTLEKIDSVATTVKTKLTGADKREDEKTVVEGFCDEHWHGVATSIITVIVIMALTITVMIFLGIIKICVPSDDKCRGGYCDDVDDESLFNEGVSLSGGGDIF